MTDQQWKAVESVFTEVCELPPDKREAWLTTIADDTVREEVISLLEHAGSPVVIDDAVGAMANRVDLLDDEGQRFGVYRVVRRLGQGGQGSVFEALRDDGTFRQRVAVKVVNWEIDGDASRARLRLERQILAGLEHPHIARLLDGGETQNGMPYFVMEFIEGQPLTAAAKGWPIRRKLFLFLEILDAVAFAHRNLIVHRDLKPANILVTTEGKPKLLDFGIAKLIEVDPQQTQTAFRPLSPGYASPEQVRGVAISTTSDVYSLGVVLFELLTSRKPYQFGTATPWEVDRVISEEAPAAPGLGDDLDSIVLMALRKEPERRYGGATQFADDIRRYLDQRPVQARPDTLWYRTSKYAKRHWVGILGAVVTLTAICGGAGVAVYQAHIAEQRFNQVRRLAHSFVFDYHDELAKLEGTTAVREKMVHTALEYIDNLAKNASGDVSLQKELAAAYRKVGDAQGFPAKPNLGHVDQAIASYKKAAALYELVLKRDPQAIAEAGEFYSAFTSLLTNTGDYANAAKTGQKALSYSQEAAQAVPDRESAQAEVARAWNLLGDIDDETDQEARALEKYQKAEQISNRVLSRWHNEQSLKIAESTVNRMATASQTAGRLQGAEAAFSRDETVLKELLRLAPNNPAYRRSYTDLSQFRAQLYCDDLLPSFENPSRSRPHAQHMLELARQVAARDTHDSGAQFTLAVALYRLAFPLKYSDAAGAVRAARESLQLFDKQIAEGRKSFLIVSRRARAVLRLSEALLFVQEPNEARALAGEAYDAESRIAAHDNPTLPVNTRMVLALLAEARASEMIHDSAQAKTRLNEALLLAEKIHERNRGVLVFTIPLARAQQAVAAYWRRAGDPAQERHWTNETQRLWQEFPEQSEFVRRQRN